MKYLMLAMVAPVVQRGDADWSLAAPPSSCSYSQSA
jgi:hypothetical protein